MAINIAPKSLDTSLAELLHDVANGKEQLPEFQRKWTWDDNRIRGILASLSQGYPMGAIMRLEYGNENVKFKYRPIEGVDISGVTPEYLILDGQQRLTSMYRSTYAKEPVDTVTDKGNGMIHRDIKPSNIILTDEGTIRLIDFNAARTYDGTQNKDTQLLGTEGYAAPEQYGFSETDYRADIYSVGVTLKELCKGDVGSLKRAVNGCTEFDPEKRYKTVKELRKDLKHPYRRVITGGVIAAIVIAAIVTLFACVDVPKLFTQITGKAVYDADMLSPVKVEYMLNDYGSEYFSDGEGEIRFAYGSPENDIYGIRYQYPDAQIVDFVTPNTALIFRVSKENEAVVENLKIRFKMNDILLLSHGYSSENVELTDHVNGIGMYGGAVWTCDGALSEEQFMLDFKNAAVFGDSPSISVTVTADGFEPKTFDIKVKKSDIYYFSDF